MSTQPPARRPAAETPTAKPPPGQATLPRAEPPLLRVDGLSCRFGGLVAVDGVSLEVRQGEIFGLLGPNGAGKTTLFNLISGLTRPTAGSVAWRGQPITGASSHGLARLGMARTFQNLRLFGSLNSLENVLVGLHRRARQPRLQVLLGAGAWRRHEAALRDQALALLDSVGIAAVAHRRANDLSYGQRRRLEIARALATAPTLLLLDEPAAGMNPSEKRELSGLIRRLRDEHQLTVLIIEHHVPLMMELCDRLAVLNFGRRIALGRPAEVRRDPAVIAAYLGAGGGGDATGPAAVSHQAAAPEGAAGTGAGGGAAAASGPGASGPGASDLGVEDLGVEDRGVEDRGVADLVVADPGTSAPSESDLGTPGTGTEGWGREAEPNR